MSKYLIPSLKEIKELYKEIIPMMRSLKTKDYLINLEKEHKVTMEIKNIKIRKKKKLKKKKKNMY